MRMYGAPAVAITPNPVDTSLFDLPTEQKDAPAGRRFLTVANLNANKRVDLLLHAFAMVIDADASARLCIVGDGPLRTELERIVECLGLTHAVRFAGAGSPLEVRAAMWDSTCFVSSSRYETFGIAIAEALATGLPVVVTRSGGAEEVVAAGSGLVVPTDDVAALASGMLSVPMPTRRDAIARRQTVVTRYSPPVVAEAYVRLYRRAIAANAVPSGLHRCC
jgi:glycosyltransferase involved in cell wall biosynthesis